MRLAIDVGNTQIVFGFHNGSKWDHIFRFQTDVGTTEDQFAAQIFSLLDISDSKVNVSGVYIASVVPALNRTMELLAEKWFHTKPVFIQADSKIGIHVDYEPPTAVGADRIANALGALAQWIPPIIVVDFGTATTFDAIDKSGSYVGGAILPGPIVSAQALYGRAAKLPQVSLEAPKTAIGKSTTTSLQSGLVLGYGYAIDGLAKQMSDELGGATIIATGGLGDLFQNVCKTLTHYEPNLTLDGILVAAEKLTEP